MNKPHFKLLGTKTILFWIPILSLISISLVCVRTDRYYPLLSAKDGVYRQFKKTLEFHQDGILLKVQGDVSYRLHAYFRSYFKITVKNNSSDTLEIPYQRIIAEYPNRPGEVKKLVYKTSGEIDIFKEPIWRIPPKSKQERDVAFRYYNIPGENKDEHVIVLSIGEIKKVPSGVTYGFSGQFRNYKQ